MIKRLAFATFLLCILGACGNKGPLVLPEKPAAAEPATPEPADEPAPTDDANADEGDGDPGH